MIALILTKDSLFDLRYQVELLRAKERSAYWEARWASEGKNSMGWSK